MPKLFEKKWNCKWCQQEIGLFEGKWYNPDNDNQLHFPVCPSAPHKKTGNKSQYRANSKGLDMEAVFMHLNELKQRVENIEEAVKGLVMEVSYKKASDGEPVSGTG